MSYRNLFVKKLTLKAIAIIFLAACFYFYEFIIQAAPLAITENLMHDFAIDATGLGIIFSCFYYAYTPLQLTTGLLLDRYSARTILTCVCATFSFGALIFAHAPNVYIAAIARFIMGGASSCAFIGVLHLAARWVPPAYFALFAGIVEMMGAVGGGVGTEPFALLLNHYDWRTIITGFAYAGFILATLIAIFVRNQPSSLKIVVPPPTKQNFIWHNLKTVLSDRETWLIGIYSFLIWSQVLGFATLWGAKFLQLSCSITNIEATHAIACVWIGIALTSPFIGWLSDFIGKRCIIMTICAIIGTVTMAIVIFVTAIPPMILNVLMFALGFASAGQTLSFALIKDNNSPHTNSTANGFNNMCVVAGGLLFPILIGKILDICWQGAIQNGIREYSLHSYQMAIVILILCYFIATIISMFFIKETNCRAVWHNEKKQPR